MLNLSYSTGAFKCPIALPSYDLITDTNLLHFLAHGSVT